MVHQFAMMLPEAGDDARVNIGLGLFYRNPKHAPYTGGHIPATHTFGGHHEAGEHWITLRSATDWSRRHRG